MDEVKVYVVREKREKGKTRRKERQAKFEEEEWAR